MGQINDAFLSIDFFIDGTTDKLCENRYFEGHV